MRRAVFLLSPSEHRRAAFLLQRNAPDDPRAQKMAKINEGLAKVIQKRLDEGTARIARD
jgi:hypothetical protein